MLIRTESAAMLRGPPGSPASIAHQRGLHLYVERQLMEAFGSQGVQLADTLMDYHNAFLVAEISTRQLTRPTAAGTSAGALHALIWRPW